MEEGQLAVDCMDGEEITGVGGETFNVCNLAFPVYQLKMSADDDYILVPSHKIEGQLAIDCMGWRRDDRCRWGNF